MAIDLQTEMLTLRRNLLAMGAATEQRLSLATSALVEGDVDAARAVKGGDAEIDAMEVDLETQCMRILALGSPVAHDLRFVLSVIRISADFERIVGLVGFGQIGCKHPGLQAELRVVHRRESVRKRLVGCEHHDGRKGFLAGDRGITRHVLENDRVQNLAFNLERGEQLRAARFGLLDPSHHIVERGFGDHRSDHGFRIARIAGYRFLAHRREENVFKFPVNGFLDEDPLHADAGLTRVGKRAHCHLGCMVAPVGIRFDHARRVAA